jgi:small subunit ribosomal protein S16
MDARAPRDGKVLEELGHYDPLVRETDARAVLDGERIEFWLSRGALPSETAKILIKKYGRNGTHLEKQRVALERLKLTKPQAPPPLPVPKRKKEEDAPPAEAAPAAEAVPAEAAPAAEPPAQA